MRDLLEAVGFVNVVHDEGSYGAPVPVLATARRRHAFGVKCPLYAVHGHPLCAGHLEDSPHDGHGPFIDLVTVASAVEPEPIVGAASRNDLTLLGLTQLSAPGSLGGFGALVLRELVEDAVRGLPLRRSVAAVVQRAYLRPVVLELAPQEVVVRRLPGEAVPVLGQDNGHPAGGHEVPYAVHPWPFQGGTALAGVRYLLEDFVAFALAVDSQGFELLGEGVTAPRLLVGGDAGVENSPPGAVAVRRRHAYSPISSEGSTSSAPANFRSVLMWGSLSLRSSLATVFVPTSAFAASSSCVRARLTRRKSWRRR